MAKFMNLDQCVEQVWRGKKRNDLALLYHCLIYYNRGSRRRSFLSGISFSFLPRKKNCCLEKGLFILLSGSRSNTDGLDFRCLTKQYNIYLYVHQNQKDVLRPTLINILGSIFQTKTLFQFINKHRCQNYIKEHLIVKRISYLYNIFSKYLKKR